MKRCPNRARHWFTYYGWVGSSAPRCRSCGEPNPNYRPHDDPYFGTDPAAGTPGGET